jgi:transcriptional regulator with XRE-family HTH domain
MENIFSERLKEAVKLRSMLPKALAEEVGLTDKAIYAFMSGKSFPSLDSLSRVSAALQVSTDFLLGKADTPTGIVMEEDEQPMAAEILFIRRAYKNMSPSERRIISSVAQSIMDEHEKSDKGEESQH